MKGTHAVVVDFGLGFESQRLRFPDEIHRFTFSEFRREAFEAFFVGYGRGDKSFFAVNKQIKIAVINFAPRFADLNGFCPAFFGRFGILFCIELYNSYKKQRKTHRKRKYGGDDSFFHVDHSDFSV